MRPRGVLLEGRPRVEVRECPTLETRPLSIGFGVENGDPGGREGDDSVREMGEGEEGILEGGSVTCLMGLPILSFRELSCLAVILAYFAALEPGVILSGICLELSFGPTVDLER